MVRSLFLVECRCPWSKWDWDQGLLQDGQRLCKRLLWRCTVYREWSTLHSSKYGGGVWQERYILTWDMCYYCCFRDGWWWTPGKVGVSVLWGAKDCIERFESSSRKKRRITRIRTSSLVVMEPYSFPCLGHVIIPVLYIYLTYILFLVHVRLSFILKSARLGLHHRRPSMSRTSPLQNNYILRLQPFSNRLHPRSSLNGYGCIKC